MTTATNIFHKGLHTVAATPTRFIELLQPASASGMHFPVLDGVRAMAMVMVFMYHAWYFAGLPALKVTAGAQQFDLTFIPGTGYIGVNLFFVLSGFFLFLQYGQAYYQRRPYPSTLRYLKRRLLRIVPAYYASVFILVTLSTNYFFISTREGWNHVFAHLLFTHNLYLDAAGSINGALWTLGLEMQFYLLLPLLARLFVGRRWMVGLPLLLGLNWIWRYGVYRGYAGNDLRVFFYSEQLPGQLVQFGFGMIAANAWLWITHRTNWTQRFGRYLSWGGTALTIAGMLLVLGLAYRLSNIPFWDGGLDYYWLKPSLALGLACIVFGLLYAQKALGVLWGNALLRLIGIVSYSIFLWHFPVLQNIAQWPLIQSFSDRGVRLGLILLAGIPVVLLYALASYWLVERPFLQLSGKRRT